MGNPLLDRASPHDLADRSQVIEIIEKIDNFPGLAKILQEDLETLPASKAPGKWRQFPVDIRLSFGWADARRRFPVLQGTVRATVAAVCQRCLEPFELPLALGLKLRLTRACAAPGELEGFEDWELEEDTLRPLELVEEALIMALPRVALHEEIDGCVALREQAQPEETGKLRPFANLRANMDDAG